MFALLYFHTHFGIFGAWARDLDVTAVHLHDAHAMSFTGFSTSYPRPRAAVGNRK